MEMETESSNDRSTLAPPTTHRQFSKTYSMPLSAGMLTTDIGTQSPDPSNNYISRQSMDNLQSTDFSFAKLESAFWSAREQLVVKARQGSVLTRGLVVKTDHFAGVRRPDLGVHLQGAPNFRQADMPGLQVYGVAQPTITGLKTILSVLQCAPLTGRSTQTARQGRGRALSPQQAATAERSSSATPNLGTKSQHGSAAPALPGSDDDRSHDYLSDRRPSTRYEQQNTRRCVWACTRNEPVIYVGSRPFVLREADRPFENFQLSERADNLESIEQRLKTDILREATRYGGLLMVHEEDENGKLKPAWVAVGPSEVKTMREVWDLIRREGWRCDYHRIPIAEDQPMENDYLDAYTQIIKDMDPQNTAFVANCGMGVRRTSFAMVAAVLVRRRQLLLLGRGDAFHLSSMAGPEENGRKILHYPATGIAKSLQVANERQTDAQATLQIVQVLDKSLLEAGSPQRAVEVLLTQPLLLDALRNAKDGDYGVIRQLIGLLDDGERSKVAVDMAIDACSHVIHLRHNILEARVRYALATPQLQASGPDATNRSRITNTSITKAVTSLEQYFLLLTFGNYVSGSETAIFKHRFATWLRERKEISHLITRIRSKGSQLYFFDPIADLSVLSKQGASQSARALVQRKDSDPNLVPGDEFADHVVRNRAGLVLRPLTLLKEDIWRSLERSNKIIRSNVRGAVNFRRIPYSNVFATGQPTVDGIRNILRNIEEQLQLPLPPDASSEPLRVTFINLREEPLCHVNGKPYCLRQKGMSLRNIKSYSGISWSRLTLLEDRLKNDILNELSDGDGRLLLHTETEDGELVPLWEQASASDVETLQDVMSKIADELITARDMRKKGGSDANVVSMPNVELIYRRVPITAEKPPDFSDLAGIMRTVLRSEAKSNACIVLNCQLGRGRSTLTSVIVLLISRWLRQDKDGEEQRGDEDKEGPVLAEAPSPLSYHIINSLLRVIPHGLAVKRIVDREIDRSASVVNLRNAIEDARLGAEDTEDESLKRSKIQAGVYNLRRYFELIVFQAYLDATPVKRLESMPTFETFVKNQPVFSTLSSEFDKIDLSTITPLQKVDKSDGMALNEEVQEVVSHRQGDVLSAYTMLKSDMFPGLAAQALSHIEGIPNMRGVSAILGHPQSLNYSASYSSIPPTPLSMSATGPNSLIETWGHGMPSIDGLRRGLEKIGAGPNGTLDVIATSLREEAVCVINGRPHVLRLADQPFTNVEATGITTEAVERMEDALKQDVLREIEMYDGRILLHDEKVNEENGKFELFPLWESVKKEDVLTPSEMYTLVQRERYRVQYARVAVTDEQAPIPAVFHEMEERVLEALRMGAACVWNCQMGRGRTTTGMVIAALVSTVAHHGGELFESDLSSSIISWSGFHNGTGSIEPEDEDARMEGARDVLDDREDDFWLQGEYRSVLQLVAILKHGKLAKKLSDAAIDRMDAVQNLRKAIYDSKLRASNADRGTSKYRHLRRVYVNYLQRYSYLIVFANYLLEKSQTLLEKGQRGGQSSTSFRSGSRDRLSQMSDDGGEDQDDDDDDEDDDEQQKRRQQPDDNRSLCSVSTSRVSANASYFAKEESRQQFPTFVKWLQPRREITKICNNAAEEDG